MPGCRRGHMRLNAPVQGLEDNLERYMTPVMPVAFPRGFNLSHSKRCYQDQEQSAAWHVACGTLGFFYVHLLMKAVRGMTLVWPVPSTGATY